ncbi:glutamate decareboxylase-like protein [Dinothrombium tinctorium]|uniref:Glutamate decareboxylase-like protein n=1 Tax=Dinothrombium tinctorium TaxID=1965070 RepID=A0A3S4R935_9ACAR|nr:glutamate decareboxylase-like protein [Dinothrombium tinctorium]RWS13238.1 glutamate decareboxylase-like protein [Dinothrombium tinctorium]
MSLRLLHSIFFELIDKFLEKQKSLFKPAIKSAVTVTIVSIQELLSLRITKEGLREDDLVELCRKTIHYSVKTSHPHFHNQLYAGIDEYSLAGSWLTEALNSSQATYEISPVFTLVERAVLKYLGAFCSWKEEEIDGIFSPGGSIANMYGIVLARHKMFPHAKQKGIYNIGELVLFISEDAHYSFIKGAIWLGFGSEAVIKVKTDEKGRMDPYELDKAVIKAKQENKLPFFVGCTAGTTVLGAFDPLIPISNICKKHNLWMHVDAALGGTALFSPRHRVLLQGIEFADSITWNLHKLAAVSLQCSAFLTRHQNLLTECNSFNAEYLFQSDKYYDSNYDSGDKSIQCGRKVDSFKLWLALAARGERKIELLVDNVFEMVEYAVQKIRERPSFRLVLSQFESSNVCFWYLPPLLRRQNCANFASDPRLAKVCPMIKSKMMERGNLMVNYQPLKSKNLPNFFRIVFTCYPPTTENDIDFVLDEIENIGSGIII